MDVEIKTADPIRTLRAEGIPNLVSTSGSLKSTRFWGLISRKPRWGISPRGWLVFAIVGFLFTLGFTRWVHPYLAVTDRVQSEWLVVEGWIPNDALRIAIAEFQSGKGSYKKIVCTGGPFRTSIQTELGDTHAHSAAFRLQQLGVPKDQILIVPCQDVARNRTFASAVAFHDWIRSSSTPVHSVNLVTVGTHARRSRLMFQRALGDGIQVGVISVPDSEYDAGAWWKYSEGAKSVMSEVIGYAYARLSSAETTVVPVSPK